VTVLLHCRAKQPGQLQQDYAVDIDWRGFELHPETPPGERPITERIPPERLPQLQSGPHEFAAAFGVDNLALPERLPNTRRALAIAEYARDQGKLMAFRDAAMRAHWREGKDLEDEHDLREIARRAGLAPEAALRALGTGSWAASRMKFSLGPRNVLARNGAAEQETHRYDMITPIRGTSRGQHRE
jgi:predicted DsbA family dithiol-disulfide isomerase